MWSCQIYNWFALNVKFMTLYKKRAHICLYLLEQWHVVFLDWPSDPEKQSLCIPDVSLFYLGWDFVRVEYSTFCSNERKNVRLHMSF